RVPLAERVLDAADHLRIRDLAALRSHHGPLPDGELAQALIRNASRTTAAVGAASGAMLSAEAVAPTAWLAVPAAPLSEPIATGGGTRALGEAVLRTLGAPGTPPAPRA